MNLSMKTYDFPFGMNIVKNLSWGKFIPFFPTFQEFDSAMCPCTKSRTVEFDLERISVESCEAEKTVPRVKTEVETF